MNKRALVTGATGFVGSHLVRGLLEAGWDVSVIIRETSKLDMLVDVCERITVHQYTGEINQLTKAMVECKPSVVFHVASLVLSEHKPEQINALIESNILFGTQLLEAMVAADVKHLINTSTFWEHFENKEYSPVNLYAASKRAFQDIMQFYIEAKGINVITLKLFDTYGADDPRPKLLNLLMRIAETGEKLAMSPGEQEIDLVHIDDVVQAYLIAAQRLLDGDVVSHEVYGVGTGKPLTLKELAAMIEKQTGKTLNIEWGGRPYRDREILGLLGCLNMPKNWKSNVSIKDGIHLLLNLKESSD